MPLRGDDGLNDLVLAEHVRHLSVEDQLAATLRSITQLAVESTSAATRASRHEARRARLVVERGEF